MEVTVEKLSEGVYTMKLDKEARCALHEVKWNRRGEPEATLLRRFVLGGLALFKVLSEENPDQN